MPSNEIGLDHQSRKDLAWFKNVLTKSGVSKELQIKDLFFSVNKDDGARTAAFETELTVGECLNIDPETLDTDAQFEEFALVADISGILQALSAGNQLLIKPPNAVGYSHVTAEGLQPTKINGKALSAEAFKQYDNLHHSLRTLLGRETTNEFGLPVFTAADLTNAATLDRLVIRQEDGTYTPAFTDYSKFQSDMKNDVYEALHLVSNAINEDTLHIRDEDGTFSKLETSFNGSIYRGELDNAANKSAQLADTASYPHGAVAMFFAKLFHSIGIPFLDYILQEQEDYINQIHNRHDTAVENRRAETKLRQDNDATHSSVQINYNKIKATTSRITRKWDPYKGIEDVLIAPESNLSKRLDDINQTMPAYQDHATLCMLAGILGRPAENENDLNLDMVAIMGLMTGKKVWDMPQMANYLQDGAKAYWQAESAMLASGNAYDPKPMATLIKNTLNKFAKCAGNLQPLDDRAVFLGTVAEELVKYAKNIGDLSLDKDTEALAMGVVNLGRIVKEGLLAQQHLASGQIEPENLQQAMGNYLTFKTVEQMTIANLVHNRAHSGEGNAEFSANWNPGETLRVLGTYGKDVFQYACAQSDYVQNITGFASHSHEEKMAAINRCAKVAFDGFQNGNNAAIVQTARKTALAYKTTVDLIRDENFRAEKTAPNSAAHSANKQAKHLLPDSPDATNDIQHQPIVP